jgi:hypothetical protein
MRKEQEVKESLSRTVWEGQYHPSAWRNGWLGLNGVLTPVSLDSRNTRLVQIVTAYALVETQVIS